MTINRPGAFHFPPAFVGCLYGRVLHLYPPD
nr:MAG TPA_asm: hypothetical protein [Caudoviricetes sp.]